MSCNKCRQTAPWEQDSWCLGCSGLETLQTELSASWKHSAFRAAAHDVIVGAVRSVRTLRSLSSSCHSADRSRAAVEAHRSVVSAAPARAPESPERGRTRLPTPPPPPDRVKAQEETSEEDVEEEEEEDKAQDEEVTGACPKRDPSRKPPEPSHPPPQDRVHQDRPELPRSHRSGTKEEHRSGKKKRKGDHRRGSRGGGKHQRTYRQLEDPLIRVHRRPPASFWESERPFAGHRPGSSGR